jgi:hypothetical protein
MKRIVVFVVVALGSGAVSARVMKAWSYKELVDAADVVAIVTPTKTKARSEKAPLPGMVETRNGKTVPILGLRWETELAITVVLKGTPADPKRLVLHHYAETRTGPIANGPLLVAFDPKEHASYLVFLKKGADGQYVAVTGQTDPLFSFDKLQQPAR